MELLNLNYMNELMTVGELGTHEVMSSLQIAEITGKAHDKVCRDIDVLLSQGVDIANFGETYYTDKSNRKQRMYEVSKKGCLILASGYDALLREKIINRWEELEKEKRKTMISLPDFTNPAEAAIAWAEQYKQKEAALIEAKQAAANVKRLIHDNKTYTASQIAKELNLRSANELNKILSEKEIQYKQNETWLLYAKYADCGYVSIKQMELDNGKIIYDRRFSGKGRDFIINLLQTSE